MAMAKKASAKKAPAKKMATTKRSDSYDRTGLTAGPKGKQPGKNINVKAAAKRGLKKSDVLRFRADANRSASRAMNLTDGQGGVRGKARYDLLKKASRQQARSDRLSSRGR